MRTTSPAATLHARSTSAFITILRAALDVEHEGSDSSTWNNFVDSDACPAITCPELAEFALTTNVHETGSHQDEDR
jgi:hypothetical protein